MLEFVSCKNDIYRNNGYNHFHKVLRLFYVLPNFLSPQVKRCASITYKHGIYELPHELPDTYQESPKTP